MKSFEDFSNCLEKLSKADFESTDPVYRSGIIWHFRFSFRLGLKALKEAFLSNDKKPEKAVSMRQMIRLGYLNGMIDDEALWLLMLRKRSITVHVYSENEADQMISLIRGSFMPALFALQNKLTEKLAENEE